MHHSRTLVGVMACDHESTTLESQGCVLALVLVPAQAREFRRDNALTQQ